MYEAMTQSMFSSKSVLDLLKREFYELIEMINSVEVINLDFIEFDDDMLLEIFDFKYKFLFEFIKETDEFKQETNEKMKIEGIEKKEAEEEIFDDMYMSYHFQFEDIYRDFVSAFFKENNVFVTRLCYKACDEDTYVKQVGDLIVGVHMNAPIRGCW